MPFLNLNKERNEITLSGGPGIKPETIIYPSGRATTVIEEAAEGLNIPPEAVAEMLSEKRSIEF